MPRTEAAFVLGVVCTETRPERRAWLRSFYAKHPGILVRFVLSDDWLARQPGRPASDEVGVPVTREPGAHCVDKSFGWWRIARRWPAAFYGKTDDDALIDPVGLLPLLTRMPREQCAAGTLGYTSIRLPTLEAGCWARGAAGALRLKRQSCRSTDFGPYPFASGPLELLSSDVVAWLAPRLRSVRGQRCQWEDRLVGLALTDRANLTLVNLWRAVGNMNVVTTRGKWLGADAFVAHWVRSPNRFSRVIEELASARREYASDVGCGAGGACSNDTAAWSCRPLADELAGRGGGFPCCDGWTQCAVPGRWRGSGAVTRAGRLSWAEWEARRALVH